MYFFFLISQNGHDICNFEFFRWKLHNTKFTSRIHCKLCVHLHQPINIKIFNMTVYSLLVPVLIEFSACNNNKKQLPDFLRHYTMQNCWIRSRAQSIQEHLFKLEALNQRIDLCSMQNYTINSEVSFSYSYLIMSCLIFFVRYLRV